MSKENDKNKKPNWGSLIFFLLLIMPQVVIPIGIIGIIGYAFYRVGIQSKANGHTHSGNSSTRYTTRSTSYENCDPKPFCLHKDKGLHHVRRGREIDPWDRPDIDISKYQRKH